MSIEGGKVGHCDGNGYVAYRLLFGFTARHVYHYLHFPSKTKRFQFLEGVIVVTGTGAFIWHTLFSIYISKSQKFEFILSEASSSVGDVATGTYN